MASLSQAPDVLEAVGAAGAGDVDIASAALAMSAAGRGGRDLAPHRRHLAEIADMARVAREAATADPGNPRWHAAALSAVLHRKLGYAGDSASYDDLKNADLAHVIERRRGLPVALGILYIHAARAFGASAHGINFPGHFLVGVGTPFGAVLVDPFHGGRLLEADDLETMLPQGTALTQKHVAALTDRGTLIRLQNNIIDRARPAGAWQKAAMALEPLVRIAPDVAQYRYELGQAFSQMERPNAARAALQDALALAPDAPWAHDARSLLAAMKRTLN